MAATVSHGVLRGDCSAPSLEPQPPGWRPARRPLAALGGFLVVTDAPTSIRATLDLWGPAPDEVGVDAADQGRRSTRRQVLNPGRFVAGI